MGRSSPTLSLCFSREVERQCADLGGAAAERAVCDTVANGTRRGTGPRVLYTRRLDAGCMGGGPPAGPTRVLRVICEEGPGETRVLGIENCRDLGFLIRAGSK